MIRRLAALVLVVAAVFAAAQVGLVRVRRSEALALRRRLGDVQATCAKTELALKKDLQAAHVRSEWLHATLDRKAAEAERLRGELVAARQALELVQLSARGAQSQLDSLRGALDGAADALRVELVPDGDLRQLVARATNASAEEVELLEASGQLWIGGRADGSGYSARGGALGAGEALELFEYSLFGDEPERVRSGSETLRAALCFVWGARGAERLDAYWFEYRPETEALALLRRDGMPLAGDGRGCDLEAAAPPW